MVNHEHTSKQYDAELESVRSRVLLMGELVEKQVRLAFGALRKGDAGLIIASSPAVSQLRTTCEW